MKHLLFLIAAVLLTGCPETKVEKAGTEGKRAYIVPDPPPSSDKDVSTLGMTIQAHGGELKKRLKYQKATVYHLTPAEAEKLKRKGIKLEEDVIVTTQLFSCEKKPEPTPTPTPPPGTTPVPTPPPTNDTVTYGLKMMKALDAHGITSGETVKVCITDTGMARHTDLARPVAGENFTTEDPRDWVDRHGHGTHVAGTIAAVRNGHGLIGVAPKVELVIAKVLSDGGSGSSSGVADGVGYCVAQGAAVINMSLGSSSPSSTIHSAIKAAKAAGVKVVCAAGNSGTSVGYPAKFPECIAVSAIDSDARFATFSNYGPEVEFAAPGVGVKSTYLDNSFRNLSGTSMATPHVAGCLALAVARNRHALQTEIVPGLSSDQQGKGLPDCLQTVR